MYKVIIIFLILILKIFAEKKYDFNLKFFQDDYHLVPEWFEVISYDKKYVTELKATVFKRTRTITALNLTITFNINLGNNLEIVAQIYKFASNEYREFPLRMQVNFCQVIEQDFGGLGQIVKCGNFTGCPVVKAIKYHFCNWTPDASKHPPYIPTGRYMEELQGMFNSTEIFLLRAYVAIVRPFAGKQ